jgi:hypothetical protein
MDVKGRERLGDKLPKSFWQKLVFEIMRSSQGQQDKEPITILLKYRTVFHLCVITFI